MSKEAMKLALEALEKTALIFGDDSLSSKAAAALREALAEQPYEIGTRLAREGKGISDLWGAVKSDADMAEAQRGYEAALAEQPAQRKPLKDEEIEREWQFLHDEEGNQPDHHDFARAIEAKLRSKNEDRN